MLGLRVARVVVGIGVPALSAVASLAEAAPPRAVLLGDAHLFTGPDLSTPLPDPVARHTVVDALAIGTEPLDAPGRPGLGAPAVFVRVDTCTGWLHGQEVAIAICPPDPRLGRVQL